MLYQRRLVFPHARFLDRSLLASGLNAGSPSTIRYQLGLMEECVVDMGDADQCHRRAVGQGDRRIPAVLIGRRYSFTD